MKILETYLYSLDDIQNNLILYSFLINIDQHYKYDKISFYNVYKTKDGIFLKRPEMYIKSIQYKEVLINITDNLGKFKKEIYENI